MRLQSKKQEVAMTTIRVTGTTVTTTLEPADTIETSIEPHRFTIAEFQKMYELGLVPRRSQLIRGEIYFMAAMGAAHAKAIRILNQLLSRTYVNRAFVVPQCPIIIWNDSQPEPDFALVQLESQNDPALAKDVLLAIEVSDSSLKFDRHKKLPDYAKSRIPEAWILNLNERHLEVYRQPDEEHYLSMQIVKPETLIAPLFAPEAMLEWWRALPEAKTNE
jgi:Uma2 family endonuclease